MSGCGWFPMSWDQIRAWIDKHPESLPTSLADLCKYPVMFRRVMVNMVAPEVRERLWREHLESFLNDSSGLSAEQQSFVASAIGELGAIFAAGQAPNPTMSDFESRLSKVFSRQEAALIFGMVGPPEPPEGIPLPPDALA